jgi:hypothetical protein
VESGNLVGEVELVDEPLQVTEISTRRLMFFLGSGETKPIEQRALLRKTACAS